MVVTSVNISGGHYTISSLFVTHRYTGRAGILLITVKTTVLSLHLPARTNIPNYIRRAFGGSAN